MRRIFVLIAVLGWSSVSGFTKATKQSATLPAQKAAAPAKPLQPAQKTTPSQGAAAPAGKTVVRAARPAAAALTPGAADIAIEKKAKEDAAAAAAQATAAKAAAEKQQKAVELVHEWFIRWNALGENTPDAIDKFVELYEVSATHETGPGEKQAGGPVSYRGEKLIRKMAQDFAKKWNDLAYAIDVRTEHEKSTEAISISEMPWGNTQLAVEYKGGQTDRETKKRYMINAAAFFEFQNDKISRVRVYMPKEEITEVSGPLRIM